MNWKIWIVQIIYDWNKTYRFFCWKFFLNSMPRLLTADDEKWGYQCFWKIWFIFKRIEKKWKQNLETKNSFLFLSTTNNFFLFSYYDIISVGRYFAVMINSSSNFFQYFSEEYGYSISFVTKWYFHSHEKSSWCRC